MRLRSRRRNLVVWSSAAPDSEREWLRLGRSGPLRRWLRLAGLLTVIGLLRLSGAARPRWRHLLAGGVLTVVGFVLRGDPAGLVLIPGLLFLLTAPFVPAESEAARTRHRKLERELAAYTTPSQRRDLEAILDRYPDGVTCELRDILARQSAG